MYRHILKKFSSTLKKSALYNSKGMKGKRGQHQKRKKAKFHPQKHNGFLSSLLTGLPGNPVDYSSA
jgi:hypothetical protein